MKTAYFNWSSGKDSAFALYKVLQENTYNVKSLVTSVNKKYDRVSMHGVPIKLLEEQAKQIGIPLSKIYFPEEVSMEDYNTIMKKGLKELMSNEKLEYSIFGDIYLEDLRKFREEKLAEVNLKGAFPIWKMDTKEIIEEFIDLGFKAITVSVNANLLDESFVGRVIDKQFVKDLPANVDVCGENGEFHTFVFEGPIFKKPIEFKIGEKILRTYPKEETDTWDNSFWYCDLLPI